MEHIIFIWDGSPKNYINVCLESLRLYNQQCIIHFHYSYESIKQVYQKFNIDFVKINNIECKNKLQYYKILITKRLCETLNDNDKILITIKTNLFQHSPLFPNPSSALLRPCCLTFCCTARPWWVQQPGW